MLLGYDILQPIPRQDIYTIKIDRITSSGPFSLKLRGISQQILITAGYERLHAYLCSGVTIKENYVVYRNLLKLLNRFPALINSSNFINLIF
jgi:hypothetical protein